MGAAFGIVLLTIGLARAALALLFGAGVTAEGLRDLLWAGLYVAAFALAGGLAGALSPLRRTWWGALLVGYIAAGVVGAACGVIAMQSDGTRDMRVYAIFVGFITVVFGTLAAYRLRQT